MQKKVFPVLFATLLIDMIGVGMVIPIIPIIFTDPTSTSFLLHGYSQSGQYFIAGLITAIFGLMQFIAAPVLGELSDVYGRKKLLTLGVGVLALSQFFFAFGIQIGSLAVLLFSRAIAGLAGANFSIAQASIADVTEPKDRAKNFGLIGAAFGIGFILGPLPGGWISAFFNNAAAPFWTASILGLFNVIFISLFLPETCTQTTAKHSLNIFKGIQNIKAASLDTQVRSIYLASFLYVAGFSFFTSFIGVLLVSRFALSEAAIGTFFGASGVWIVITQLFILRILSNKYHEKQILRFSLILLSFVIAAYPFMPNIIFLYTLVPLLAIPQGLSMANMGSLISKSVSMDKQGAALGINGSLMALSQGVIPLLAGLASGSIGIYMPFVAGSIFVFFAWFVLFLFSKENKNSLE